MSVGRALAGMVSVVAAVALARGGPPADDKRAALPDNKTIDSLHLSVTTDPGKRLGPVATLTVTRDGKVTYSHATAPHTGSGGKVTQKRWDIPPQQAAAILAGVVEDGLLDLPAGGRAKAHYYAAVTYGRWQMALFLNDRPDKVLKRVLPLLRHAHPEVWGAAGK